MGLREKIFEEFRRKNLAATYIWNFNEYASFCNSDKLNAIEKREFTDELMKMCEEDLLICEGRMFRLTKKCEIAIWGE